MILQLLDFQLLRLYLRSYCMMIQWILTTDLGLGWRPLRYFFSGSRPLLMQRNVFARSRPFPSTVFVSYSSCPSFFSFAVVLLLVSTRTPSPPCISFSSSSSLSFLFLLRLLPVLLVPLLMFQRCIIIIMFVMFLVISIRILWL